MIGTRLVNSDFMSRWATAVCEWIMKVIAEYYTGVLLTHSTMSEIHTFTYLPIHGRSV